MTLLEFLISVLAGIFFWNRIAGQFEGDRRERSLRIPLGGYYFHVHHWLYCFGAIGGLYWADVEAPWAYGLLAGSVAQGLTYGDWYLLLYKKDRAQAIYARWSGLQSSAQDYDV